MSKRMLAEAQRVIDSLGIVTYLEPHRDNHRKRLMEIWRISEGGKRFARESFPYIESIISKGVTLGAYRETRLRISDDRIYAERKIPQFVLYYILERAVVECQWNLDEWREMRRLARNALLDLDLLALETAYFVSMIPGLEDVIVSEFSNIEHEIREEQEFRHQGTLRGRLLNGVSFLGQRLLAREELEKYIPRCIEEIAQYAHGEGSAKTLLTLYVVYYACLKCSKVYEIKWAAERFEGFILDEIRECH